MCGVCCPFQIQVAEEIRHRETFVGVLEPGERIILTSGYGYPASSVDVEHVIARVSRNSALTADGTRIYCEDEDGIRLLPGEKVHVVLSEAAKQLLVAAGLQV